MVSLSTLVIVKVKTHDQESLISSPVNKICSKNVRFAHSAEKSAEKF